MAWQRPDQFRKVISSIGSFTAIMGGDAYPDIIRTNEAKPIRIFLEDGINDNRGVGRAERLQSGAGLARAKYPDGGGADGEDIMT